MKNDIESATVATLKTNEKKGVKLKVKQQTTYTQQQ